MTKPHIARIRGWWFAGTREHPDMRTRAYTPRRALELLGFYRYHGAVATLVGERP